MFVFSFISLMTQEVFADTIINTMEERVALEKTRLPTGPHHPIVIKMDFKVTPHVTRLFLGETFLSSESPTTDTFSDELVKNSPVTHSTNIEPLLHSTLWYHALWSPGLPQHIPCTCSTTSSLGPAAVIYHNFKLAIISYIDVKLHARCGGVSESRRAIFLGRSTKFANRALGYAAYWHMKKLPASR